MADYTRIRGSKEKIGIVLSTNDSSNFVVESATVRITFRRSSHGSTSTVTGLDKGECAIDNKTPQKSHRIEYLWECTGDLGIQTAAFSAKLSTGELIVRSVTIAVE